MVYENRICCFLDILGFKEHIEQSVKDDADDSWKIQEIHQIISFIQELIFDLENETSQSKMVTHFSDSVVISFKIDEKSEIIATLVTFLHVAFECANRGFFIRGGVSYGKLIHRSDMVFGPALNEAYFLESKKALYPRIIVNKDILDYAIKYRKVEHGQESLEASLNNLVQKDEDGEYYIEYINNAVLQLNSPEHHLPEYLNNLNKFISKGLLHKDKGVIKKYEWLKKKYNTFIQPLILKIANDEITFDDDVIRNQYKSLKLI